MARKRLSDLLREEVQKPAEAEAGEATTPPETPPKPPAQPTQGRSRTPAKSSRASASKPQAASTRAKPTEKPAAGAKTAAQPEPAPTPTGEREALLKQVSELQSSLAAAQRREDLLKRQVMDLETELEQEKERSQQLQQTLNHTGPQTRPLVSLPEHPAASAASAPSAPDLAPRSSHPVSVLEAELEKIFRKPVSPEAPYKELTSEDIGWMD